jgi:ERCC4-type nuclease
MESHILLKVDNREKKIIDLLQDSSMNIIYKNLDYGDFIFEIDEKPLLIIERKSISDLISSVKDTRYNNQKLNLLNTFDRKQLYYILEGSSDFNEDVNSNDLVISCIINTMIRDDIKIFYTKDVTDTFHLLNSIWKRLNNNISKYVDINIKEFQVKKISNITKENCFMYQLMQIPGISFKSAKAIVDIYPTMTYFYNELSNKTFDEKMNSFSKITTIDNKNNKRKLSIKVINNLLNFMF